MNSNPFKTMIFPFDRESEFLTDKLLSYGQMGNMQIKELVSMPGWGLTGDVHKGYEENLVVKDDFKESLNSVEVVCIVNSWLELSFSKFILPVVKEAAEKGKAVLITRELSENDKAVIHALNAESIHVIESEAARVDGRYLDIDTPIVAVGGATENCAKLTVELGVKEQLEKVGYNVLLITSRNEGTLLNSLSMPNFMLMHDLSENEKVRAFNHFLADADNHFNPDIIIIGIPGSMVAYDEKHFKDYGILAMEISRAVSIDAIISCSFCGDVSEGFLNEFEERIESRFGVKPLLHFASNYCLDTTELITLGETNFFPVNDDLFHSKIRDFSNVYNPYKGQSYEEACKIIIEYLSGG